MSTNYSAPDDVTYDRVTEAASGIETAIDPVCMMDVDTFTTTERIEHAGKTYYFCSPGCRRQFKNGPGAYTV